MLWSLFVAVALAQNACYYAANKRAGSAIVPCSGGSGVASCCQIGDLCLADSACWNPTYDITYLYGCTDSSYTDANCPYKCGAAFENATYVGLDYCSNTTRNEWSCTHPPNDDPAISPFNPSQCYDDSIIAFAGPSVLQPILSLPTAIGGSTVYFSEVNPTSYSLVAGYTPTTTPTPSASVPASVEFVGSTSTGSRSTTGGATATSTGVTPTHTSSSGSSGLSTGAKAGIGAGIGGAAIALAIVVVAWMVLRKRRTNQNEKDAEIQSATSTASPVRKPLQTGPSELPSSERKPSLEPSELPESESHSHYTPSTPTYPSWTRPQPGQQVHELPSGNMN